MWSKNEHENLTFALCFPLASAPPWCHWHIAVGKVIAMFMGKRDIGYRISSAQIMHRGVAASSHAREHGVGRATSWKKIGSVL